MRFFVVGKDPINPSKKKKVELEKTIDAMLTSLAPDFNEMIDDHEEGSICHYLDEDEDTPTGKLLLYSMAQRTSE